ncbi:transcriptional regulator [Paenibacillus puldeungensis]|uniref:Transcriptional regulator n=1 Tax=Paenibacillus puldeungensis TaxID=696536 RepID=A0ABW3RRT2_9BACL
MSEISKQIIVLLCFAPFMLTQSLLLFRDAQKKGAYPWLWGLWGLIQLPMPTIFYYFFVVRPYRKRLRQGVYRKED